MKHTKRIFLSLLAGLMALTLLAACDGAGGLHHENEDDKPSKTTTTTLQQEEEKKLEGHTHTAEGWQIDGMNHWRLCVCGEVMEKSAHTVKDSVCTGCEAEVVDWEDGTMSIWQYDEHGSAVLKLDYDAEGNLTHKETGDFLYNEDGLVLSELYTQYPGGEFPASSDKTEYTYSEEGRCLSEKQYINGMLYYECEYALDADGEEYISKDILYNYLDGTKLVKEYDENSEMISSIWYGADGKELDHSGKFDAEACKDLFGTWRGELDIGKLISEGMFDEEFTISDNLEFSCKAVITLTFRNDGAYSAEMKMDPDEYKTMMIELAVETMYIGVQMGGMTRAEADAYFESSMGMTIREYVEASYAESEDDLLDSLNESAEGVYYVEKDKIYLGDGWNQSLKGGKYALDGDTLTLIAPLDMGMEMELVLTKTAD